MRLDKLDEAILKINPAAKYICRGSDINTAKIEWLEETAPISKEDIKSEMDRLQAIEDAK